MSARLMQRAKISQLRIKNGCLLKNVQLGLTPHRTSLQCSKRFSATRLSVRDSERPSYLSWPIIGHCCFWQLAVESPSATNCQRTCCGRRVSRLWSPRWSPLCPTNSHASRAACEVPSAVANSPVTRRVKSCAPCGRDWLMSSSCHRRGWRRGPLMAVAYLQLLSLASTRPIVSLNGHTIFVQITSDYTSTSSNPLVHDASSPSLPPPPGPP
mmetsp:Transcript_121454/g.288615  ORF Transcript_121454/g.288615 Transcript_121454/m.288615 type:complete len:212 (+) Transcript_121454:503-1138(+)